MNISLKNSQARLALKFALTKAKVACAIEPVYKTFLASFVACVVTRLRFLMCDGSQNCYYDVVMLV